jgi:hypothetical protein
VRNVRAAYEVKVVMKRIVSVKMNFIKIILM